MTPGNRPRNQWTFLSVCLWHGANSCRKRFLRDERYTVRFDDTSFLGKGVFLIFRFSTSHNLMGGNRS